MASWVVCLANFPNQRLAHPLIHKLKLVNSWSTPQRSEGSVASHFEDADILQFSVALKDCFQLVVSNSQVPRLVQVPGHSTRVGWLVYGKWSNHLQSFFVLILFGMILPILLDYTWPYYLQYTGVGHTSQVIPSDQEWHPAPLPPNWQESQQCREDLRQLQDRAAQLSLFLQTDALCTHSVGCSTSRNDDKIW